MNRTKMILKSTIISLSIFLVQGILSIIRTGYFIKIYGADTNGVVQLSSQIFSYLVLFESGLGAAYLYKMYEPFEKKDFVKVHSLFKGLTISLKKISVKMLLALIVISILYPLVLASNSLNYIKIVLIILLLGIRFIIPYYFYLSKKNLMYVYEKKYIADSIDGIFNSFVLLIEIIMCYVLRIDILIVLSIGILVFLTCNYIYNFIVNKECNDVLKNIAETNLEANSMTKDILVHQICSIVFSSTDSVILSIFNSLNSVTIYNAYFTILSYPATMMGKLNDNIRATFGKKMVSDKEGSYKVFKETISLSIFLTSVVTIMFLTLINKFITLWIGNEFLLSLPCVILFSLILISKCTMPTIFVARDSKALYKESKKYTIWQAIANICISLALTKPFGIMGLLIGTVVSTYLILIPFNYNIVYKRVFEKKNDLFAKLIGTILYIMLFSYLIGILNNSFAFTLTWASFILIAIIDLIIITIVTFILEWMIIKDFKLVIMRFINIIRGV